MEGFTLCWVLSLVLLSASQFQSCIAEDPYIHYKHLKLKFVHELAEKGRFRWKSLTVLFTDDAINDKNDWIFEIKVPKVMIELSSIDYSSSLLLTQPTDAYLILTNEQSTEMTANSMQKLFISKQLDSSKTFLIFSQKIAATLYVLNDLDLILVEDSTNSWKSNTGIVNKPILRFSRYRSLSSLELAELSGYYEGGVLKADQKHILFDPSFNYRDRPVKVTTFNVPPTTIDCSKEGKDQTCGRDPNLIRVIGEVLHFQPVFISSPVQIKSKWGDKLENGTWTGLIGEVSRGETILGVANVFMTLHYMEQVEFSYPYDISCSTFLTPSPELWPQLYALIKPFDLSIWMATMFSLLIGGLLIQVVALTYHKLFGSRDPLRFFGDAMIYNAQSITGTRSGSDEKSSWPVRIYTSNWWLFYFLLGTVYRTGLISWLARSPILMAPVDTIAQLVRSDLTPYGYNTFVRDLAQYSSDPDTIQLGGRLKLVPPNMTVQFLMGKQNFNAIFENKHYLKYLSMNILPSTMLHDIAVNRIDPRQRLHVMHECLRSFPVAIAMTPGTPLKSAMTQIIHQLNAAGIIDYWLDTVVHSEDAMTTKRYKKKEPFSLHSLEGAFYLLLLCYSIDIVAFVAELVFHRVSSRQFILNSNNVRINSNSYNPLILAKQKRRL